MIKTRKEQFSSYSSYLSQLKLRLYIIKLNYAKSVPIIIIELYYLIFWK